MKIFLYGFAAVQAIIAYFIFPSDFFDTRLADITIGLIIKTGISTILGVTSLATFLNGIAADSEPN